MPRKTPVQARSKLTVSAILEATAQVLVSRGFDKTTTDAIAERAGVSIGTLYQYFPNKEVLIDALIKAHVEDLFTTIDAALSRCESASLDETLQALIRAGLDAHRVNPALHKVLVEQVPRKEILAEHLDVSATLQRKIEADLRRKAPGLPREQARMTAFVLETCIEALTHRAIVEAPDWLTSGKLEQEAKKLLAVYLDRTCGLVPSRRLA